LAVRLEPKIRSQGEEEAMIRQGLRRDWCKKMPGR